LIWDLIYKVQVSAKLAHVVAVTKAGRLFTWGHGWNGCLGHNNSCDELWPKRVEHGGFAGLFIVCASTGHYTSTAIDSSGLVPIFCFSTILDIATL
jgi:alpha-tubulin suppressor-like RCC1 family protein